MTKSIQKLKLFCMLIVLMGLNHLDVYGQTYTFTSSGATGRFGPTQSLVNTAYNGTNLSGQVNVTDGIQQWVVPQSGWYSINAAGAQGGQSGSYIGGLGASMQGDFFLAQGTILNILVGQTGETSTANTGGGGGSFVWIAGQTTEPLIAAGGGGGAGYGANGISADTATSGTNGTGSAGTPGTGGNGANPGGAGWKSDGLDYSSGTTCAVKCTGNAVGVTVGGASPLTTIVYHGCAGSSQTGDGGFGGASGGNGNCTSSHGAGGGGGYSGGVGQSGSSAGGGGGGSYNAGTNQINIPAIKTGDGEIVINFIGGSSPNNAGITSIPSLAGTLCPGIAPVTATVVNFGNNNLDSVFITWSVNGTVQPGQWFVFNPALDTAGSSANSTIVNLGSFNLPANTPMTVKAWTSLPNNVVDMSNVNDTSTVIVQASMGGNYTINAAQPTGGTNYNNFNDLVNDMVQIGICGPIVVDVVAGSGPYNEQVIIPQLTGTSSINTITINGNGEEINFASSNTNERAVIKLDGADFITIDSLTIVSLASGTYGFTVQLINDADSNTIKNCKIYSDTTTTSSNWAGIVVSGSATSATTTGSNCDGNMIMNNTINGGYYSITMTTADGNSIVNNVLSNFYYYGIYNNVVSNHLIESNDLSRVTRSNVSNFYAIYQTGAASNVRISKNSLHDPFTGEPSATSTAYVIYITSSDATLGNETIVSNNKMYNMTNGGTMYAFYNTGSNYVHYYHNTVSIDDPNYSGSSATRGLYQTTAASGIEFKNNIIHIARAGSPTAYGVYWNTTTTTFAADNNDYFIFGGGTNYIARHGGNDHNTLAAYQTSSSQEANSVDVNPIFANQAAGDLTPTNSLLDDLGALVGIADDILGNTRSATTPDIGAYEFSVPPCFGTPVAGTASELNSLVSGCIGQQISLSLSGFSIGNGITLQWEESPAGAGFWTPISGATTSTYTATLIGPTDYRAVVTCANGGGFDVSNTISLNVNPFYLCYCSPNTNITLHGSTSNYLTKVELLTTTLNNSTSAVGPGGYTLNYPLTSSNTASIVQGQTYQLITTTSSTTANNELWIDWDQNGLFDSVEYITFTQTGAIDTATFTVPVSAVPGLTGLRVRDVYSTSTTFGAPGSCDNISLGRETEDYVITVVQGIPCSGTPSTTGNISANDSSICNGSNVDLTLSNYPMELGLTYQWEESPAGAGIWTAIPGATGYNYTTTALSSDMDYRMAVTCTNPGGGTAYSNILTITVNNPQLLSTNGATRCGVGTVNLTATASLGSTVNWYADMTSGSPLDTGNTFITPVLTATDTFYASAIQGGVAATVGRDSNYTPGDSYNTGSTGIYFDALAPFTLNSVMVYPYSATNNTPGTITIALQDNNGVNIQTATVNVIGYNSAVGQTVALNFNVPAGTGYRLIWVTPGSGITGLYREYTATPFSFPYTVPGVVNMISSWNGASTTAYYYYFYRWQITTGCEGSRVPVIATVTTPPAYTLTAAPDTICAGGSSTLTASSSNNYTYTWTPGGTGSSVQVSPVATTKYLLSGVDGNNCVILDSVIVNVKSVPATVVTSAVPATICTGDTAHLSLNPIPMYGIGIQWQKNTGSGFTDINGANSDTYSEYVTTNTIYQAKLYCNNSLVMTSDPDTVDYVNPSIMSTIPGVRCGPGPVSLGATAASGATLNWYANMTGGSPLGTGGIYTTPALTATTTYYVAAAVSGGTSGASPIQITEFNLGTDELEIQNVSGAPVDVTGWKVAISDDYANINAVNANVQTLAGILNPGDILSWTDASSAPNYWGSNMLWNPGAYPTYTGWAVILDANNNLMDVVFMNWPVTDIQNSSITIGSTTLSIGSKWTTGGVNTATVPGTDGVARTGTMDHNNSTDFTIATLSIGSTNPTVTLPFTGFGCEGTRVPVTATINSNATPSGLAQGGATVANNHADGTTVSYQACANLVVTVEDTIGNNVLGNTFATTLVLPSVQAFGNIPYVQRVYDITPASDGPATVTLYALQSEFNAYNSYVTSNSLSLPLLPTGPSDATGIANIVVTQYHGMASDSNQGPLGVYSNANVELIPNSAITASSNGTYWTITFPVSGFSGFFIHTGANPLSIDLKNISAVNVGNRNRIDWATGSETHGDRFELERSTDGTKFTKLADITAKGAPSNYTYWDEVPVTGINYYRIKMIDVSGKLSYSRIVNAVVRSGGFTVEAYPNPVKDVLTVKVFGVQGKDATVSITDITGKVIRIETMSSDRTTIEMSGLAQGMYLIKYADSDHSQTIKVNKQ